MNFLSHGRNHLDDVGVLPGTALPDWLRILGRTSRLDPRRLPDTSSDTDPADAAVLRGIRLHFEEDSWFHTSTAFRETQRALTDGIRERHPDARTSSRPQAALRRRGLRASFFAHILMEILLDAWLSREVPDALDRYYATLDRVDDDHLCDLSTRLLGHEPPHFHELLDGFRTRPFLRTYGHDGEVVARLDQVARRVGLPPMPPAFVPTVGWARLQVDRAAPALLQPPQGADPQAS